MKSLNNPELTLKLKNNFPVSLLMKAIDIDFIFAAVNGSSDYMLLNVAEFGTTSKADVESFIQKHRVVIINNETMEMHSFNIDEQEMLFAMLDI